MCHFIDHLMSGCGHPNDWPSNGRDGREDGDEETFHRCAANLLPQCQRGNPSYRPAQDNHRQEVLYHEHDGLCRDRWNAERRRREKAEKKARDMQRRGREDGSFDRAWEEVASRSRR